MKASVILFALFLSSMLCAQSTTNAGEYMSYFSGEYQRIQEDMWDYTRSVSHGRSARTVEKRRGELIASTGAALKRAKSANDFNGNARYRDSVVLYFTLIDLVLREDYAKVVDMEAVAEQSYDAMEAYMMARELASDKMVQAGDMIRREHETFAAENHVTLIETETKLGQKMEIADKVYDHYNAVYLIFFKSYKQELYLLDAIGRNDVSAIEQNRNALLGTLEQGLEKLETVEKYEGDASMMDATRELFKFYQSEAEKDAQLALNYIETNERFTKIKEAFDAKKEKSRTQEDVDQYNAGVDELNKAVNDYNAANEKANAARASLIDAWNNAAEKFTDRHVPKGK
jgi:hypothetical protein